MGQYITFEEGCKGVNGYFYQKGIKYKIKSQDIKYYYVMSDKIQRSETNKIKYEIGDIVF